MSTIRITMPYRISVTGIPFNPLPIPESGFIGLAPPPLRPEVLPPGGVPVGILAPEGIPPLGIPVTDVPLL